MKNASIGIVWGTLWLFSGFSLLNPAWSVEPAASAEIDTGIRVDETAPRCPPFDIDDTWIMHRTITMAAGMRSEAEITITVTEVEGANKKSEWAVTGGTTVYSETRQTKGMLYPVKDTVGSIEIDYVSETPFCPPPDVGQSIVGIGRLNGMEVGQQIITVMAIEPNFIEVSVPAGTFKTRKIMSQATESGPQASAPYTMTHYFADGIGSIREVFIFADGSIQIHELIEYEF